MVGLPDTAVKESQDRVTTAVANSGFAGPAAGPTINLAPADIEKEGPSFDLPIALGMVAVSEGSRYFGFRGYEFRWRTRSRRVG